MKVRREICCDGPSLSLSLECPFAGHGPNTHALRLEVIAQLLEGDLDATHCVCNPIIDERGDRPGDGADSCCQQRDDEQANQAAAGIEGAVGPRYEESGAPYQDAVHD